MYLLHGDNIYESWQELMRLRKELSSKDNNLEFVILDSQEIDISKLQIAGLSMFAKRNFYILKRFFSLPIQVRENIWAELIKLDYQDVIFWEDRPVDKRLKLFKDFSKIGIIREYKQLKGADLSKWIIKYLNGKRLKYPRDFVEELIFRFGNNQSILESEIEKLAVYMKLKNKLNIESVDYEILSSGAIQDNWKFIEHIFQKQKKEAIMQLRGFELGIEEELMVVGGIASTLRNLYLVKLYSGQNLEHISTRLGINPYALRKAGGYATLFTLQKVEKFYEQLMNFDYARKIGRIDFKIGLELLIMSL